MISEKFSTGIEKLKEDNISGSAELVTQTLQILEEELLTNNSLQKTESKDLVIDVILSEIIDIKEEMITFRNISLEFLELMESGINIKEIPSILLEKAIEKKEKLIENLAEQIYQAERIMTISRSSTIVETLETLMDEYITPELIILESRPNLEGKKLAQECIEMGYQVIYGVDSIMNILIEEYNPDMCLIGADTIYPNGDVLNKIGSYSLALIAKKNQVPFHVVASTNKIMLREIELTREQFPAEEVWEEIIPANLEIKNEYFEKIPSDLIVGYITEKGMSDDIPELETKLSEQIVAKIYRI